MLYPTLKHVVIINTMLFNASLGSQTIKNILFIHMQKIYQDIKNY